MGHMGCEPPLPCMVHLGRKKNKMPNSICTYAGFMLGSHTKFMRLIDHSSVSL